MLLLDAIPKPSELVRITKSLATLDAILCQEWTDRYFSFDSNWSAVEQMASMRDGEGDDYFVLFTDCGAAIKGFSREANFLNSELFFNDIKNQAPNDFSGFVSEPAFSMDSATFVYFFENKENRWRKVLTTNAVNFLKDDGASDLLSWLIGGAEFYKSWARDYYEIDLDLEFIENIFQHAELNHNDIKKINPEIDFNLLSADLQEINYPSTC